MISLSDLGLKPAAGNTPAPAPREQQTKPADNPFAPVMPEPGSVTAQALYRVWDGQPISIVDSPPGAGKTSLITHVANWLVTEAKLHVVVVTPTVAAGESLARRLVRAMGPDRVVLQGASFTRPIDGAARFHFPKDNPAAVILNPLGHVVVRTVASAKMHPPRKDAVDVMIFDEAYQTTFDAATAAADTSPQILMVGDPGQIGPVNTADTTPWDGDEVAPHHRAPEGLADREDAEVLHLPSSFRLGPRTTEVIAPLYDFQFDSLRPQARIGDLDEVEVMEVEPSETITGAGAMTAVADRVALLVGQNLHTAGADLPVTAGDVAVLAARNQQTSLLTGMLRDRGLTGVTVGTADRLQGGQWAAVVALDPFYGSPVGSAHSRSLGRLCVMLSRHIAHLTWVASTDWRQIIENTPMDSDERQTHLQVRQGM